MKFSIVLFSAALIAGVAAQSTTTSSSAPYSTTSSYGADVDKCLAKCDPNDKNAFASCNAACLGTPTPTKDQADQNTKCALACPQGNGSQADTEAYGKCLRACAEKYFLPNVSNMPNSGATTTGTNAPTATDSNGNKINSSSTTTSPTSTSTNGASAMVYSVSFGSVVAVFAAFLAL